MFNATKIKAKYPTGSKGGQCVIFCRKVLPDLPTGLFSKADKKRILETTGGVIERDGYHPVTGDMIVTNQGSWGHVAIINEIISQDRVKVSESNWKLDERIGHGRIVNLKDTRLAYIWREHLKPIKMNHTERQAIEAALLTLKSAADINAGNAEVVRQMAIAGSACREALNS